ncbi:MAG: hypothetical protein R6W31_10070 [Bacteroidales bacterium]
MTLLMVPAGELREGQGRIELGAMRRFEMSELDQGFAAAAYRVRQLTVAAGVMQFGDGDYYAERTGLLSAAYCLNALLYKSKQNGRLANMPLHLTGEDSNNYGFPNFTAS